MHAEIVFFLVSMITCTPAKGSDISLTSSPGASVFLTQYGYTYVPGVSDWFTFTVKACRDAEVYFHSNVKNSDSHDVWNYRVILGGWGNTRSQLNSKDKLHDTYFNEASILSCTEWRSFWVSWKNGDIVVGKGQVLYEKEFMKLEQPTDPTDFRFLRILTRVTGQWKIPDPGFIRSSCSQWRLLPGSINFNITRSISWIVSAPHMKDCARACARGLQCVSFVYNGAKGQCQGHSKTFNNVADGGGIKAIGSYYYVRP